MIAIFQKSPKYPLLNKRNFWWQLCSFPLTSPQKYFLVASTFS